MCAGPALIKSSLTWTPDVLLWFTRLSNCDLLFGMKNASSSLHLPFVGNISSVGELNSIVRCIP